MLKVGLYGFGNIAQAHKRAYDSCAQEGLPIQLTAACDITEERLKICRNCNDIHTYQFIEDMLKMKDSQIAIATCNNSQKSND